MIMARKSEKQKVVRYHDNSHAKRKFKGNRRKDIPQEPHATEITDTIETHKIVISYYGMMKGE